MKKILVIVLAIAISLPLMACSKKVTLHCDGCGKDYDTVPQGVICPYCGSEKTWLLTGNEVNIKEISVE